MPLLSTLYNERLFPWLNDKSMATPEFDRIRKDAYAQARGRVLEIGFGSGLGLPFYSDAVKEIIGVEPNPGMRKRAEAAIARSSVPIRVLPSAAESIDLPDASVDTAVSCMTLCSVRQPARVLAELKRVLRPDGRLIVIEHGLADDPGIAAWQRRLDWLQGKLACGCRLTLPVASLLRKAGADNAKLEHFFAPKMPKTHGWLTVGSVSLA